MNELLFIGHCLLVMCCLLVCVRIGKEAVISFISLAWILANLCVLKQITLFGLNVTAADMYAIGALLGVSVVQELWGKKIAKKTVLISFVLLVATSLMTMLHLQYIPSPHDTTESHFVALFSPFPKLMLASLVAFLLSNALEIGLFSLARNRTSSFALVSFTITAFVAIVDTIIFVLFGLLSIVQSPLHVCLMGILLKISILLIASPFLLFVHRIAKEKA